MKNLSRDGIASLYERFLGYEVTSRVMDRTIAGVQVWALVRFFVFESLLLPQLLDVGAAHPDIKAAGGARKPSRGVAARIRSLLNRFLYSPSFPLAACDVLFALAPRQMRLPDGREVTQMLDFFLPELKCSSAVLEFRNSGVGYPVHSDWSRVFHLDGYEGKLRAFVRSRCDIAEAADLFAAKVASGLRDVFGVACDERRLSRAVVRSACLQLFYGPLFRKWLRRLKVKCVVTVVNYSTLNQVLCASAHAEGVPVVELQHGTVYRAHPAYNLPRSDEVYAPDYLFTWGRYWTEQTRHYALRRTLSTGYPALEYLLKANAPLQKSDRRMIVFISQGTIGAELSRRAVELRGMLPTEKYELVYKLHPNETNTWRELYPWLLDSGVEVVSSSKTSVYSLFRGASAAVGVYSTAVIESLMWNLKGYVFGDLPGGDTMAPFLREGLLENVASARDLAKRLEAGHLDRHHDADGSDFWQPDAAANIVTAIREIIRTGEVR